MPGSATYTARVVVFFFTLSLLASCSLGKPSVDRQAQSQTASVPAQTSESQSTRISVLEEKMARLEEKVVVLETEQNSDIAAGHRQSQQTQQALPPEKKDTAENQSQPTGASINTSNPAVLYQKARQLLLAEKVPEAAAAFSDFVRSFPTHDLANNALYWLGECSYTTGNYEKSVEIFKQVVQSYPKGKKVPDALLKTGYAYISIDDTDRAVYYLKRVITQYPFSPAAEKAQQKLSQIQ